MASPQQLSGKQFQLLVKPKIVWVVQSGVVSVYAVALTAVLPTGRRQFLFEVHPGEWILGAECQGAHIAYGLMVMVSDRHATLVPLPFEQASDELDAVQLNIWLNHIAPYVESVELDEVRRQLLPTSIPDKGTSTLNQEALTPCARLTQQFLTQVRQQIELKHAEKISQLQQQERIYRQSLQEGLVSLAQVLTPDYLPVAQTEEDELLQVIGSIGRHLNVEIVPPKNLDRSDRSYTLEAIARSSGLRMRPVKLTANWWKDNCGTLVGSCGNGRPIALLPTLVNRYTIYDPRQSQRKALTAEVANTLETDAWQVYRPFPDRPLSSGDMFRFVLRGRSRDVVTILVMSLAASILGWLTPIITGELIEQVIPNAEVNYLMQLGLLMIGASIGAGIFQLTRGFMLVRLSMLTDMETQAAVWDRVLKLPAIFFRDFTSGDLLQRINSITEIQKTLSATTLSQLLSGLFLASNLILMFWYSPRLALGPGIAPWTRLQKRTCDFHRIRLLSNWAHCH
ncbi:MAG: ABC transporter transmembrane domain-containing protein [Cyanobacteria bacterium P01_H01_bin.15]